MKIAIRKESNGLIYVDKTALNRFDKETLMKPPYNFSFVEVEQEDFEPSDFNDDLTFSLDKYNARKQKENSIQMNKVFNIYNRDHLLLAPLGSD